MIPELLIKTIRKELDLQKGHGIVLSRDMVVQLVNLAQKLLVERSWQDTPAMTIGDRHEMGG